MSCKRYWVAECDFHGNNCLISAISDAKQTRAQVNRTLEILGWRWEGKKLACSPCARGRQKTLGVEVPA